MPELAAELAAATGETADPASLSRWLIRAGYRFKKLCGQAGTIVPTSPRRARRGSAFANQTCSVSRSVSSFWTRREPPQDDPSARPSPERPKASLKGSIRPLEDANLYRWPAPRRAHRALRHRRADGPAHLRDLRRDQLAPTLQPGDVVILDNLPAHKSAAAEAAIPAMGAGSCFCRPIAPTSIPSRWLSPSSRLPCAPRRSAPSTPSGAPSAKSATSSAHRNAKTTSKPQDADSYESPTLLALRRISLA